MLKEPKELKVLEDLKGLKEPLVLVEHRELKGQEDLKETLVPKEHRVLKEHKDW